MRLLEYLRSWLVVGVLLLLGGRAFAQQPIEAEITYFHRGKQAQETARGIIVEETPGLITWRTAGRLEKIPAADVGDVLYLPVNAAVLQELRRAQKLLDTIDSGAGSQSAAAKSAETETRRQTLRQVLEIYRKLLPQLSDARYGQRHVAYKIAQMTARLAEDDPSQSDAAMTALASFVRDQGGGWQVGRAARLLSQMQIEKGDEVSALKTIEGLAQRTDLTRETRFEFEILLARALLRGKKFAEAQKQLATTRSRLLPEEKPALSRVDVYLAGCRANLGQFADSEKHLKSILEGDAEPSLKALACNTLADSYRESGQLENAFWRYLMVDILYNQDPEEHARALYHLSRLFEQLKKDTGRAQECRERLLLEKRFADAEYRRQAVK